MGELNTGVVTGVVDRGEPHLGYAQTLDWAIRTTAGDRLFLEHLRYRRDSLPPAGTLVHFQAWTTAGGAAGYVQAFTDTCCICHCLIAQISRTEWVDAYDNRSGDVRCFWHSHEPEIPTLGEPYGRQWPYRVESHTIRVLPGHIYQPSEVVYLNPEDPWVLGFINGRLIVAEKA